ncbi:MAG TPA: hypothetical protein VFX60_00130 [Micromonospora sp.]|nr:hypothetical protein [Micromonospora sp.]
MIDSAARTPRLLVSYALRGALVGLAACGALYFAWQTVDAAIEDRPEIDGPESAVAATGGMLLAGVPSSLLLSLLVAWAARLRHPWAVSLLGLFNIAVLVCVLGSLRVPGFGAWILPFALVIIAYAAAAVLVAHFIRSQPAAPN